MEKNKSAPSGEEERQGQPSEQPESGGPQTDYYAASSTAVSSDGRIMLGEDIEIYPARPREDLAGFNTQAFEAKDRRLMGDQIALLCGRATVPRITNIGTYKNLKNAGLLRLVEAGIIEWTPEGRQRFAFIFEKPPSRKLMASLDAVPYRLGEEGIITGLVQPVLSALQTLRNIDMVHGAINPMNIYLSGVEGAETAILGECLSAAPSYRQHALFEPVERAMAQATGRGPGTLKDDLYAFGVCVALAARGENFLKGRTERQIIEAKLDAGSYTVVTGGARLPTAISEFLRGVLSDDDTQRWDIDEAFRWLEGRRLSPKQPRAHLSAARPFMFRDEKFWDLRSIAHAFSLNVGEAATMIEQDQFDLWIKRNFEDKALIKRMEAVWEKEKTSSKDRFVTSACMALDPLAPVRYKDISAFPSGFGNALADAMAKEDDIQVYGEIIAQQLFGLWISLRFDEINDAGGITAQFEKCRNYLTQKLPGYGLERVLYTLNKECVCMSPLLKGYFVLGAGNLLLALDGLARKATRPDQVLDRHMVAFLSVREPKMIDPWLGHLTSHDRGNHVIGYIRTLAAIQKRFNTGLVAGVTAWMVALSAPAVERFNDRDLRQDVARRVERMRDSGNLAILLDLLDDTRVVQDDINRYALAQQEYAALTNEQEEIAGYLKRRRIFGQATGRQAAMLVSAVLASLCILGYIALFLTQKVF